MGTFEGGWTAEIGIPFKSIRYRPGVVQTWGFNALRTNRWKNELSTVTRLPQGRGQRHDRRQYIVVATSNRRLSPTLRNAGPPTAGAYVAFALPAAPK